MTFKQCVTLLVGGSLCFGILYGRSSFRTPDPLAPVITTYTSSNPKKKVRVTNAHFRLHPLFSLGIDDIKRDLLPNSITLRNDPATSVTNQELSTRIETALQELKKHKRKVRHKKPFSHFTILQDKNFSYLRQCGLLVLKFKEYPFVLKLFMENAETISAPHATGFEPTIFFYMGGGVNRHLSGITRIKNLKDINQRIAQLPAWNDRLLLPRKWFWIPKDNETITVIGTNFGDGTEHASVMPRIYAIIADEMQCKNLTSSLSNAERRSLVMKLCNDLGGRLDPHFDNYGFMDDPVTKFKIVIIDTEHILTMVGIHEYTHFDSHFSWYGYLTGKCFNDMFLCTKQQLMKMQSVSIPL